MDENEKRPQRYDIEVMLKALDITSFHILAKKAQERNMMDEDKEEANDGVN